jgi:hypothetical protein
MFQAILYNLYGGFLIISGPIGILWKFVLFYYLYVLSIFKFAQRLFAYGLATGSCNIYKTVSDYMYQEHKMGGLFDPATMEGCHYLVDWPMGKSKLDNETCAREVTADQSEVIDLEKIWLCRSLDPELKYECLSFSLFHLLRRRAFGFACGESKIKAHDFVFKGLLLDATNDYSRVFKVIETELAFMYDVYFTKYAVLYYRSRTATVWYLVSVTSICLTIYAVATHVGKYDCTRTQDLSFVVDTKADVTITLVILACAGVLESVQMLVFWTSVWGRVSFACQHIREEKTTTANRRGYMMMMRLKGLLANIGLQCESKKNCWQHQLGQYSLIGAVGNIIDRSVAEPRPLLRSVMLTALPFPVLDQSSWQASAVRRYERMPTKLRSQVKKAVVDSLVRTQGKLTSGRSSLVDNGAGYLSWACEWDVHPETTCIILTWHIATCYCEMMVTSPGGAETSPSVHYDVATVLSGYCAHLVVSEPKLLPGHHHDTTSVFNGAAEEAMNFLQGATNRYEAMKNVMVLPPTVFGRGVKLGKQLEGMLEDTRWKVLADFWAEMLLYAAPSDNVNEHIEKLAYGGEFITHLWALLSHAGIIVREDERQGGSV